MEKTKKSKKEWIKNAIIIFLIVMLVLTFCSDSIMNLYLPEVSTEAASAGKIQNMLRGNGTAQMGDANQVKILGNRVIKTVNIKIGSEVRVGDILFTLEESDGTELEAARTTYLELQTEYQKRLIEKKTTYDEDTIAIESAREEYEDALDVLNSIDSQNEKLKKKEDKLKKINLKIASYEGKIGEIDSQIETLTMKADVDAAQENLTTRQRTLVDLKNELADCESDLKTAKEDPDDPEAITLAERAYRNKKVEVENATQDVTDAETDLSNAKENKKTIDQLKKNKDSYNTKLNEYREKQTTLSADIDTLKSQIPTKADAKRTVSEKETAWNALIAALESKKNEDDYTKATDQVDTDSMKEKMEAQKKLVDELEKSLGETEVKSEVEGMVTAVNVVAGDTTQPDLSLASIASESNSFDVKISISKTLAGKVKQGQPATVESYWYGDDIKAVVSSVTPDPENLDNVLVNVEVKGEGIREGDSLTVSFGGESKLYDVTVPRSSVYEDNDGKFVLTLDSKRTPLGERYIVNRHDVEVIAEDDTRAAIESDLYGYEYVVMTASEALTPGEQVKLKD